MQKRKVVFLDRDGVVNIERGEYTFRREDFKLHPEIISFMKAAKSMNYDFVIITNQGGVARGLYSIDDVEVLHEHLSLELAKAGLELIDIYCSYHHEEIGSSLDRKPDSLMLERAIFKHNVDVSSSIFIGDSERDIFAASKVKIRGFKIEANTSLMYILNELNA
ncbi:MAG: HAD-IIIA family hydrolase [Bacteroidota bacterium]